MGYIKLEEAIEKIDNLKCECDAHFYGEALTDAKSELLAMHKADVVEVVRCKDCGSYNKHYGECTLNGSHFGENGYCCRGTRTPKKEV